MRTVLLLGLIAAAAFAQEQSGQTFKSGVTMIQVPVVVRDKDGHAVGDLEKTDFRLTDNGKPVEIAAFTVEKPGSMAIPDRSLPDANGAKSTPAPAMDVPERFILYFVDDRNIHGIAILSR